MQYIVHMYMQMCIHTCMHACMHKRESVCVLELHETNTQFARIFAQLHNYSNVLKVFECTTNDFGVVILVYLVNIYIFKAILVIQ